MKYNLNDIVMLKKIHPCGNDKFEIIRLVIDIKINCIRCGHVIMLPRVEFNKKIKKVINNENEKEEN